MAKKEVPVTISIINTILKEFLKQPDLLKKRQTSNIWNLRGGPTSFTTQDDKESNIVMWPFPIRENLEQVASAFTFYFAISVMLEDNDTINELNIRILKEDISLPTKADFKPTELLLRAEWMNDLNGTHAQPHWHIHSYTLIDELSGYPSDKQRLIKELLNDDKPEEDSIQKLMAETEDVIETQKSNKVNRVRLPLYKFHLSMIADWDKELCRSQSKSLDSKSLQKWLPQCLNYIKVQIEYLLQEFSAV